MEPPDGLERAIEHWKITTRAETDRRILDDAFVALLSSTSGEPSITVGWRVLTIRRIAIPAAVAAAILLAFVLFINTPLRKTVSLRQIQTVLAKEDNVCISIFRAGEAEPFRQIWASKPLGIRLFKIGRGNQAQFTLWDVPNGAKKTKYISSGYIQTEPIPGSMVDELEKSGAESFGLIPFADANGVPDDAQWSHLDDKRIASAVPGSEVYDLTWTTKGTTGEVGMDKRWRLFADARTHVPKRAEWYTKPMTEDDYYGYELFAVVSYPTESDIQDLVQTTFGPSSSDTPEPIGTPGAER